MGYIRHKTTMIERIEDICNINFRYIQNQNIGFDYVSDSLRLCISLYNNYIYIEDDTELFEAIWNGNTYSYNNLLHELYDFDRNYWGYITDVELGEFIGNLIKNNRIDVVYNLK